MTDQALQCVFISSSFIVRTGYIKPTGQNKHVPQSITSVRGLLSYSQTFQRSGWTKA